MELVGYTEDEERQIMEINGIKDPEAMALAKEDFQDRTGKEFPEVIFEFNPDTHATQEIPEEDFNSWVNGCFPGGYRPRG